MTVPNNPCAELVMLEPRTLMATCNTKRDWFHKCSTSNAVREELAIERPVEVGLRSRDEEMREWWGLTNTWRRLIVEKDQEFNGRGLTEADVKLLPQKRKAINHG